MICDLKVLNKGGGTISSVQGDFSSMAEVKEMAQKVQTILGDLPLTTLINNAGVYSPNHIITNDNMELTWQVNVVSPYILTALLWKTVSDRIVNVASLSASYSIDFSNLQQEKGYSAHAAYSNSKLCNIVFNHELAGRLQGLSSATINCLDPGTVNTKMLLEGWGSIGIPVRDADNETYVATSDDISSVTGTYFVGCRPYACPPPADDPGVRTQLFEILEKQTGLSIP